jgi:hypothetical protein
MRRNRTSRWAAGRATPSTTRLVPTPGPPCPSGEKSSFAGRNPSEEARQQRAAPAREAGCVSALGERPRQPLNPKWDRAVIDLFSSGDLSRADDFTDNDIRHRGGEGATRSAPGSPPKRFFRPPGLTSHPSTSTRPYRPGLPA